MDKPYIAESKPDIYAPPGVEPMQRCSECWQHLVDPVARVAYNNGFVDVSKPYPHANWCPNKNVW